MDIAVIAMAARLPGSASAEDWIATETPALRALPESRWGGAPDAVGANGEPDRTATMVGGWLDETVGADALAIDIVRRLIEDTDLDPGRCTLHLANLMLPSALAVAAAGPDRGPDPHHASGPAAAAVREHGLAAGIAVDAACASGLYAVELAALSLANGTADVAIAAGIQAADPRYLLTGFSQLLALSPSGTPLPLDGSANGLVVGEGAVAVALKPLSAATRDGDTVHAILRGVGLGNDGRKGNLLAPDADGQLRAMQGAWARAGLDPTTAGYIECHATGTTKGDGSEIGALARLMADAAPDQPIAIGSAKALIGHTITVAGLAGLVRAIGAVRDGFIPAGPRSPSAQLVDAAQLTTSPDRTPWPAGRLRRAAVSAFGFGGTNAHVIVDAADIGPLTDDAKPMTAPVHVVGVAAQVGTRRNDVLFDALAGSVALEGADGTVRVHTVHLDARRWRIPPTELRAMLPQQLLALDLAADALQASGLDTRRVGVVVGMALDPAVSEQVVRLEGAWTDRVPALNAQRVQGQLPNFVANRLSAQLDLQGPSFVVAAGGASGLAAIQLGRQLLADDDLDAVVVGAVDAAGPMQGAVFLVLSRNSGGSLATLEAVEASAAEDVGQAPLTGLVSLLSRWATGATGVHTWSAPGTTIALDFQPTAPPRNGIDTARTFAVPNPTPNARAPRRLFGPGTPSMTSRGRAVPSTGDAGWRLPLAALSRPIPFPSASVPRPVVAPPAAPDPQPTLAPAPRPTEAVAVDLNTHLVDADSILALTRALAATRSAVADAHAAFLADQALAASQLATLGIALGHAGAKLPKDGSGVSFDASSPVLPVGSASPPHAAPKAPGPITRPQVETPIAPRAASPAPPPTTFDRQALEHHASGALSQVFGATFAELDAYTPRVRMPMGSLLLCSRVLTVEGTRGSFGPARIVTEYDLPTDASWSHHDGKPNATVIVESGQADLFLVSWLGIDAECRGERVYRLLDCDLEFQGPRPDVGETLRHDIRIERFARLGQTILFYFQYDCISTTDGRPVLSMRNGVAGFFTPAELAVPQGVDPAPRPLDPMQSPVAPLFRTSIDRLDETGVAALVHGRFSDAFGPDFRPADGSRLTLPDSEWRLVHRVEHISTSDGPHGLGRCRIVQVLRDDDWFNPIHFKDDPCMPGTLMLEGCLQAVQTWMLATGIAAAHPDGLFEPLPGLPFELRCRGQVVPGHSELVYEAQIREASLNGVPYAIADVVLFVDGTPVVRAQNVGVTIGRRSRSLGAEPVVDRAHILEYSVGDAEVAFGAPYRDYAAISPRCARMPGPPILQMTRVLEAERPFELRQGSEVAIAYDVPPDAWYFQVDPGNSMPFAVLLETALQPCGWLTAWEAAGIKDGRDLFFRNLGGDATLYEEVWPDAGTLVTRTKQTTVAESAGLLIHRFALQVTCEGRPVYDCVTSFGYFTAAALDGQKGLGLRDEDRRRDAREAATIEAVELSEDPTQARSDWRNIDRVIGADPTGGAAGLGFYEAEKTIDPTEWFFSAHFFLDPVMPGSLGLEAMLQLARWIFRERTGSSARTTPIRVGTPHSWKYRGQVRRPVARMTIELEVTEISDTSLVFTAVLRADGLPIYEVTDFGIEVGAPHSPRLPAAPHRAPPVAALLDHFEVEGDTGHGAVILDPARFRWLDDHRPTVTVAALPLAFAAEIAAEAAQQLRPDLRVVALPSVTADAWITSEGATELLVVAVADGDTVAVSLAVHVDNPKFPRLSGPKVHMQAVVRMGADWPEAPSMPDPLDAPAVPMSAQEYYASGLTFHGPALHGMIDSGVRDADGAEATFRGRPDADIHGPGPGFLLDPLLLDTATHPMWSGEPEVWNADIPTGKLAYPVATEDLRFFGPRPKGDICCRITRVPSDVHSLVFDVQMGANGTTWCSFRWTEAVVDGGPILGQTSEVRQRFIWDRVPDPAVQIGRTVDGRHLVTTADLVEPIEGTLIGLTCTPAEVDEWRASSDRRAWALGRLAAKGALCSWLAERLRPVHPAHLELFAMRPDRYLLVNSPELTAQEWIDHAGATRFHIRVEGDDRTASAWIEPTGFPT